MMSVWTESDEKLNCGAWNKNTDSARVKNQGTVTPTQVFAVHVDGIERGFPETKPTLIFNGDLSFSVESGWVHATKCHFAVVLMIGVARYPVGCNGLGNKI